MHEINIEFRNSEPLEFPVMRSVPACHPRIGGAHRWEISGRETAEGLVTVCGACGEERAWVVRHSTPVSRGAVIQFPVRSVPGPMKPAA